MCPALSNIQGGVVKSVTCSSNYGSVATYECFEGYNLSGNSTMVCGEDGSWKGSVSCVGMLCLAKCLMVLNLNKN